MVTNIVEGTSMFFALYLLTDTYVKVSRVMKLKANYVFNDSKRSMKWLYVSLVIYIIIKLFEIIYELILIHYGTIQMGPRIPFVQFYDQCQRSVPFDIFKVISLNSYKFTTLFTANTIIFFKPRNDILQGVSKLDHLVKTSKFQKYKKRQGSSKMFRKRRVTNESSVAKYSSIKSSGHGSSIYYSKVDLTHASYGVPTFIDSNSNDGTYN